MSTEPQTTLKKSHTFVIPYIVIL